MITRTPPQMAWVARSTFVPNLSTADHRVSPPRIEIPRQYNAAHDLVERNLRAGRGTKTAYIDDFGVYTYASLAERVNRCAYALRGLGILPEQRVLLALQDTVDFPTTFLGSIKAGIVPVAVNTMLQSVDYELLLVDSRACALAVSASLLPLFEPLMPRVPTLKHVIVSKGDHATFLSLDALLGASSARFEPCPSSADDPCFWLYSSGSTGAPKGTVHAQASLIQTAELYARPILGLTEHDLVFSAAKLFFAYGLGNALTFPLATGATTVLMAERPTPEAVFRRLVEFRPTIFCGVPTLYAALLAFQNAPEREVLRLRVCVSAGECLPAHIGEEWSRRFGADILDGLGSTEMLHIFLSNRRGEVEYGTSGRAVPGYELRLIDEHGHPVAEGEIGELQVSGPTSAIHYWNNREKTRQTFHGPWTRTGDKYSRNARGHYVHAGRTDDMLKVGGIYVSPIEVESALISHPAVLETAVIGQADEAGLVKPLAFVVLRGGFVGTPHLAAELQEHVRARLAHYKYPRWIEFCAELPKTATGKVQRFKLRELSAARAACTAHRE
jgi:benzoate-CoA ligase